MCKGLFFLIDLNFQIFQKIVHILLVAIDPSTKIFVVIAQKISIDAQFFRQCSKTLIVNVSNQKISVTKLIISAPIVVTT
jgi:hypothetical protein